MRVGRPHAAIETRRNPERLAEGAGKRLERPIIGVQRNFRDWKLCPGELPGRPFQQQPPAHRHRRLVDHRPEHAVELRAAPQRLAREAFGILRLVERLKNRVAQPPGVIHRSNLSWANAPLPDRESRKSEFGRLDSRHPPSRLQSCGWTPLHRSNRTSRYQDFCRRKSSLRIRVRLRTSSAVHGHVQASLLRLPHRPTRGSAESAAFENTRTEKTSDGTLRYCEYVAASAPAPCV